MSKFKAGVRVQVKLSAGFSRGSKGVVVEGRELRCPPPEGAVFVLRDGASSSCWFHEDELELLERPSESNQNQERDGKTTPVKNSWFENGELPPVGTEFEYCFNDCGVWYRAEILFLFDNNTQLVAKCNMHGYTIEQVLDTNLIKQTVAFRPITVEPTYEEKISEKYNIPLDTVKQMVENKLIKTTDND